jgi:hypothetical protein
MELQELNLLLESRYEHLRACVHILDDILIFHRLCPLSLYVSMCVSYVSICMHVHMYLDYLWEKMEYL